MNLTLLQAVVFGLFQYVLCSPYHSNYGRQDGNSSTKQQIFYGRFISTPDSTTLSIRSGAVLVTSDNGKGYINATNFNITRPEDAAAALGADSDVTVFQAPDNGFFFPGFIGESAP